MMAGVKEGLEMKEEISSCFCLFWVLKKREKKEGEE